MRNSCLGRLLAALGWVLIRSLLAAEIRFERPIIADQAQRWEAAIRENWASWETRFGGPIPRPALTVTTTSVSEMPVDGAEAVVGASS